MKNTVENFVPQGGKHCITNSLKQIFTYYGYPMSEELMFGLASGLSFLYLNQAASPMINGRTKVFEFEKSWQTDYRLPFTAEPVRIMREYFRQQSK